MIQKHLWWLLPLFFMALITPFTPEIDLAAARWFYVDGHFSKDGFFSFFYNYAIIPGQFAGAIAAIILMLSYFIPSLHRWRAPLLAVLLTFVLGAGFVVHTMLKDHWGRPRPKQVTEFGGEQPFRAWYQPNFFHQPEPSKSFPCGHCTMGFFFFSAAFALQRTGHRRWAVFFKVYAIVMGCLLGLARIAQGGHFVSDVLICGVLLWICSGFFDWVTARNHYHRGSISDEGAL